MVGPVSDEERLSFLKKVKIGFVVLVGLSGGLMSASVDASLPAILGAVFAGLVVGVVVVALVFPDAGYARGGRDRGGRR